MGAVDADGRLATSEDMIAILAHRGFWTEPAEKNSREALERAFREGFGIETDIRDRNGALVVSHDPPVGDGLMSFDELLPVIRPDISVVTSIGYDHHTVFRSLDAVYTA